MISAIQGVDLAMGGFSSALAGLDANMHDYRMQRALEGSTAAYQDLAARYNELLALSERVTEQLSAELADVRAENDRLYCYLAQSGSNR